MPDRLDRASILAHIDNLRRAVTELQRKGPIPAHAITASTEVLWFVACGLQLATQNVVDIATQIVGVVAGQTPDDYRSALEELGRSISWTRASPTISRRLPGFATFWCTAASAWTPTGLRPPSLSSAT